MLQNLQNKVALVTGGSRGIGFAIARKLLAEGMNVAFTATTAEGAERAANQLGGAGKVYAVATDVSDRKQVRDLFARVEERFGRIDVLINNAGIGTFRSVAELTPEQWDRVLAVNLSGVFYCCHEFLPICKQQGGGDIINISSLAGKNAFAAGSVYNASKAGLNAFAEAMMLDHRRMGVRVCSILPGSVATGFGGNDTSSGAEWKIAPEDIADVVTLTLRMPARSMLSSIEIRPSVPPGKA
jgi:NAD(P)-dependent dehydrogenase (short-subunit alcohol dehydrogenase family)